MQKALLVDFYDSFTNNIASCLLEQNIECDIIKVDELSLYEHRILNRQWRLVVFGPGPGHPDEYSACFKLVEKIYHDPNIFLFGVCLGHQIIHHILGGEIKKSSRPLHGRKEILKIPKWRGWFPSSLWSQEIRVQRYNSLCVESTHLSHLNYWFNQEGELMGSFGEKLLTYQFHPESVGTLGHKCLFSPFGKFLYNCNDDKSDKTERTL